MVHSLLEYDDDGELIKTSVKPIVDGGTEGFKGNARVITPGETACIECTLDLYPPQGSVQQSRFRFSSQFALIFFISLSKIKIDATNHLDFHFNLKFSDIL